MAFAQSAPRVLIVDAHPDDEGAYAAAIYKITHDLHGTVGRLEIPSRFSASPCMGYTLDSNYKRRQRAAKVVMVDGASTA
ncbi:MAG TPA: hypothetical protein VGM92_03180 [Candidatus Kapabacteria bacterium]|jgi:hypothetical protein